MAWERPSDQLAERFDRLLPKKPLVTRRRMFGCPCAFVNGNMFAGVYQQSVVVRLPKPTRSALFEAGRAQPFTVQGRTMREYALVGDAMQAADSYLGSLLGQAFDFARGLPPKASKMARAPAGRRRASAQSKAR